MQSDASHDLHGNVPDRGPLCLAIIDMINEFAFDGAERLLPAAMGAAERIAALKRRLGSAGVPTIYINDNFGKWQSDFRKLVTRCLEPSCPGKAIVEMLAPGEDDYFVLKPKHSGFFATPLEVLLEFLGTRRLILTGITGNSCVMYTAVDAYMRHFELIVPADCVASATGEENAWALEHLHAMLKADVRPSTAMTWLTLVPGDVRNRAESAR
jgi:nicotinamidase-related amidase